MIYPVAEIFHSLQGEGVWTGTPMMFVRLAGCNVGKYEPARPYGKTVSFPDAAHPPTQSELKILFEDRTHSVCTTADGQRFICDTDYHKHEEHSPEEIIGQLGELHMCITGGEPFLHNLTPLLEAASDGTMTHIETSGTLPIKGTEDFNVWITCCPKEGFLPANADWVDEWKFLVGPGFDLAEAERLSSLGPLQNDDRVYIQPINGVNECDTDNLKRCLDILAKKPEWKLSAQLHKFLGVR